MYYLYFCWPLERLEVDENEDSSIGGNNLDDCHGRLALVTGATGSTGRLAIQLLLEQGFCIRALTRNKNSQNNCTINVI